MKFPVWLENLADHFGSRRLAGEISRHEAVTALRDAITEKDDPALALSLYADLAAKAIDAWHRQNQHPAPAPSVSHIQTELFPDLKPRLYVQPGVAKPVMSLTAHDWDCAREMIRNRTEGAIKFAEADWQRFEMAYDRVRPLLTGGKTTADVAPELRGQVPLEGLA